MTGSVFTCVRKSIFLLSDKFNLCKKKKKKKVQRKNIKRLELITGDPNNAGGPSHVNLQSQRICSSIQIH